MPLVIVDNQLRDRLVGEIAQAGLSVAAAAKALGVGHTVLWRFTRTARATPMTRKRVDDGLHLLRSKGIESATAPNAADVDREINKRDIRILREMLLLMLDALRKMEEST